MAHPFAVTEKTLKMTMGMTRRMVDEDDIIDEGDITDDDLNLVTTLQAFGFDLAVDPPRSTAAPLSPRIRLCSQLQTLFLFGCSRIPPEVSNCNSLKSLWLLRANSNDLIELPQGIVLEGLATVAIVAGTWNEENFDAMLLWLALCCPNLIYIHFGSHARVTSKIFMEGLLRNETFRDKFKNKLLCLNFQECNLTEEDAIYAIFDVIQPFYTKLGGLGFQGNNIQSIQSLGLAAKALTTTINGPITSNLQRLEIEKNPVFDNLISPESVDHNAAVCLVKSFPMLRAFSRPKENLIVSSIINYQAMINLSELRYLLEYGNNGNGGGGGTRLSIWPYVIYRVYNEMINKDPNSIYNFLREGPVVKDR